MTASRMRTADGVHVPSAFSALLASTLDGCGDLTVIDAGCGAGLISIAALQAGARRVIAQDHDPDALALTALNVAAETGAAGRRRLILEPRAFDHLGQLDADVLAVNPPQRPERLLAAVEPEHRHLHEGGGPDGLQTLRTVLASAGAAEVRSTAAAVLAAGKLLDEPAFAHLRGEVIQRAALPMHPAWRRLTPDDRLDVEVWSFRWATASSQYRA